MSFVAAIGMFLVIWFLAMFIVLPIGLKTQGESGEVVPGTHEGSPAVTNLKRKALWVTLIAAVLWGLMMAVVLTDLVTAESFAWIGPPGGRGE